MKLILLGDDGQINVVAEDIKEYLTLFDAEAIKEDILGTVVDMLSEEIQVDIGDAIINILASNNIPEAM